MSRVGGAVGHRTVPITLRPVGCGLFPEVGSAASVQWKEPPNHTLEGLAASKPEGQGFGFLKNIQQEHLKKKLYTKWRLTCRFPGLQLRAQR